MGKKHVPLRTCVQCQQVRPKRELVRVVRTPQGDVQVDEKGKAAGRGAYLCRNKACWENALARERLDYALKAKLSSEDRERLVHYGQQWSDVQLPSPETEPSCTKGEKGRRHL